MSNELPEKCPVCSITWKKTPRIVCNEFWYSCEKCEKKAEDILKEQKEKQKEEKKPVTHSNGYNMWGRGGI